MELMHLSEERRKSVVEMLRNEYPMGTEVESVLLDDPYRKIPAGTKGIVRHIDDIGTIHINWENGSSLGAAFGVDKIKKLTGIIG